MLTETFATATGKYGLHTWGLGPGHRVEAALHTHYRSVAVVCGHAVWLHTGVSRDLAPLPSESACGNGET